MPIFAFLSVWAVLSIPAHAIDHDRARGFKRQQQEAPPENWSRVLFHHKPLLILAVTVAIFHFANASMLPLIGQKLALAHPGFETALVSACILVAQLVTIPVAMVVGIRADVWGRKPMLIAACFALVLRATIFALFDSVPILVAAQVLDGISAGILDILIPLVLADLVGSTGRYSMSRGFVGTVQGVGGSLSNVAAGTMVNLAGYSAAFVGLATVAAIACCVVYFAMPETGKNTQP